MPATILFRRKVTANRIWQNADLIGNKSNYRCRWHFAGPQCAARMAQITKHQGIAKPLVIAAATANHGKIGRG
jgi:hypothetical protein